MWKSKDTEFIGVIVFIIGWLLCANADYFEDSMPTDKQDNTEAVAETEELAMKINEIDGLFVGYNETEHFNILIAAKDLDDAKEIADRYCRDASLNGKFKVRPFTELDTSFDCDYVVM